MFLVQGKNLVEELTLFYEDLKTYQRYRSAFFDKRLTESQRTGMCDLREELVRKSGKFKSTVVEFSARQYLTRVQGGKEEDLDMWVLGLDLFYDSATHVKALSCCIDATNQAIGKLQSDIRNGYRDEQGKVIGKADGIDTAPPKAFIAHGGKSTALNKLCSFLEALGVEPLVVEIQPSEGRLTEPQVDEYMKQADCAIILATYGHIVDEKTRKKHPRLNVVDELGRCRNAFPDRTILLLEKGVDLPSNVSGIVYEHFTKQNMENAFIKVAKELRRLRLIRPMKPGG